MKKLLALLLLNNIVFTANSQVPAASTGTGSLDADKNWVIVKTFDESGNVTGEKKDFYDDGGRLLQSQQKVKYRKDASTVYTHVFAQQPLYEVLGQPAATTLAAPIDNSSFMYKNNFVRYGSGSTVYDYRHFDLYKLNAGTTQTDKTESPDGVGSAVQGTLGWYYSSGNT